MTFDSALFDPKKDWVHDPKVLDKSACSLWAEKVMALRAQWTQRHHAMPFYTLGMAAYLDAVASAARADGQPPYYAAVLRRHHNRLLQEHFTALLSKACDALGSWTQKRTMCDPVGTALPGFHIHLSHPLFRATVKLHWNLQVDHAPEVAPYVVLQILRLVQEALNNALKHAKANNIYLDFTCDEVASQLTISVADDGVGMGENMLFGRGQTNMMARARAAGGKLSVSNSHLTLSVTHPGTLVKLVVPLQKMGAV